MKPVALILTLALATPASAAVGLIDEPRRVRGP